MSKPKGTLELLFESCARVKILKFLFRNMGSSFTAQELAVRVQEPISAIRAEIKKFMAIGLLKIKK